MRRLKRPGYLDAPTNHEDFRTQHQSSRVIYSISQTPAWRVQAIKIECCGYG